MQTSILVSIIGLKYFTNCTFAKLFREDKFSSRIFIDKLYWIHYILKLLRC